MEKCILIFDDDQEILLVCKLILERENYRVATRTTCDDILEDIRQEKPDLILMDLRIPEIGGENAAKLVRTDKAVPHIPILFFSANMEIEAICNRSNVEGFLSKPFDVAVLLARVKENILDVVYHDN
jgi:two-component system cell cycle response regulator DivK